MRLLFQQASLQTRPTWDSLSGGKTQATRHSTSGASTSTAAKNESEPNADKSEIKRALKEDRISFYFAYGMECPHEPNRYLHGQATLPFSYYSEV